ncbi:hypothetical protein Tsubulata_037168 [Turnera subulata]|uniref:DUF4283 domain-containing protein n=1 Tax=Turnera subulata TaxID=218843 RepID=A0A9Q0GHL1_9ROSI|nr:hypothetical protein Tsubulata_037168 [Turnera subulata]
MAASASSRIIDLGGVCADTGGVSPEESLGACVACTYVVGKILGDRRPHISQIRSQMMGVWYIKGDFRITLKPNNISLYGFELEVDKRKVLKGTPWPVPNMYLCLKGWYPDMILSQDVAARKKRKVREEDIASPSQESARRFHTEIMNTMAVLITVLHDASPIHASAVHAFKMEVEARAQEKVSGNQGDGETGTPLLGSQTGE